MRNTCLRGRSLFILAASLLGPSGVACNELLTRDGMVKEQNCAEIDLEQQRQGGEDSSAECGLAKLYAVGEGVQQSYQRAAELYESAAVRGEPCAYYPLSQLYFRGLGVEQSFERGAEYLERAAAAGSAAAQFELGGFYRRTRYGLGRNCCRAVVWIESAAIQELAEAQATLAQMYIKGDCVKEDDGIAAAWALKAAEGGNESAQVLLATLYGTGKGLKKDLIEAYKWYLIAVPSGVAREIAEQMQPDEIELAERLAREWIESSDFNAH